MFLCFLVEHGQRWNGRDGDGVDGASGEGRVLFGGKFWWGYFELLVSPISDVS